jgi:hypothetical protein
MSRLFFEGDVAEIEMRTIGMSNPPTFTADHLNEWMSFLRIEGYHTASGCDRAHQLTRDDRSDLNKYVSGRYRADQLCLGRRSRNLSLWQLMDGKSENSTRTLNPGTFRP